MNLNFSQHTSRTVVRNISKRKRRGYSLSLLFSSYALLCCHNDFQRTLIAFASSSTSSRVLLTLLIVEKRKFTPSFQDLIALTDWETWDGNKKERSDTLHLLAGHCTKLVIIVFGRGIFLRVLNFRRKILSIGTKHIDGAFVLVLFITGVYLALLRAFQVFSSMKMLINIILITARRKQSNLART